MTSIIDHTQSVYVSIGKLQKMIKEMDIKCLKRYLEVWLMILSEITISCI